MMAQAPIRRWPHITWPVITRDTLLFIGGMAGIYHETVLAASPRQELIIAFLLMSGAPAFMHGDENRERLRKKVSNARRRD